MMLLKQLDPRSISEDLREEYAELCSGDYRNRAAVGKDAPRSSLGQSANATNDPWSEFNLSEFSITIEQLQKETEFPGQPLEAVGLAWPKTMGSIDDEQKVSQSDSRSLMCLCQNCSKP